MSATITPADFADQRSPRRGRANPERMAMKVWEWLVRTGLSAYSANEQFGGASACEVGPGWSFDRFGCSETRLPDGRTLHIGGEHEDHYDPDFYIYNDVIVRHRDGEIEIYGYPEDAFPPTDFHTATLVGDRIYVIGCLGYPEHRTPGTTPVYALDTGSLEFAAVATDGDGPGWIHKHTAELTESGDRIVVRRGSIVTPDADLDNYDDYQLSLASGRWTRLTARPWQQWAVKRTDGEELMMFEMSCVALDERYPAVRASREPDPNPELDHHERLRRSGRRFELELYEELYRPPIAGAQPGQDLESTPIAATVQVGDATVRYEEGLWEVTVKIEGNLPEAQARVVRDDLVHKLSRLQGAACEAVLQGRR